MHGFYRIAAAVPLLRVADVDYNLQQILSLTRRAAEARAALVVFPELCMTGYTCADLFHQRQLIDAAGDAVIRLAHETADHDTVIIIGAPIHHHNRLYNCAVVMQCGEILGAVPKWYIPNYKEFYEKRWFSSGASVRGDTIAIGDRTPPFGIDLLFSAGEDFTVGIELCEDLWMVVPPSSHQAPAGATVIANLSASNELVAKADYRRRLVRDQSARCIAGYVYTSCGVTESTTDLVFSGHAMVAENGIILAESERFERTSQLLTADMDCQRLHATRLTESSFGDITPAEFRRVALETPQPPDDFKRTIDPHPFVPDDSAGRHARCREIFNIQAAALAKRLEHTEVTKAVIGVSGGLDSTLALLVTAEAMARLDRDPADILCVTMPGYGTTERTYNNAVKLTRVIGAELEEIDITDACNQHFDDIGQDPESHDLTYENAQARERTQILMDLANKHSGLVVGTGDLSEIALGWCTYAGDHISMYAVNCGVPKTLVRYVIECTAEQRDDELRLLLHDILDTPVSPELLPADDAGEISQKTEDIIGPYELHDFFLYHTVKYGAPPEKLVFLAGHAFDGTYSEEEIRKWLTLFIRRFFGNQFKRSCFPDGPKVGSISLSPRSDWRMPSDASYKTWLGHDD